MSLFIILFQQKSLFESLRKFFLVFLILSLITSCKKEDKIDVEIPNQVGLWSMTETKLNFENDSLFFQTDYDFTLEIINEGIGYVENIFGGQDTLHWVLDKESNNIFLIKEGTSFSGGNYVDGIRFNIEENLESKQKWRSTEIAINSSGTEFKEVIIWDMNK